MRDFSNDHCRSSARGVRTRSMGLLTRLYEGRHSAVLLAVLIAFAPVALSAEKEAAAPAAVVEPAAEKPTAREAEKDAVVYITRTGKRYHRETCAYAKVKSTLSQARELGLTACKICRPGAE